MYSVLKDTVFERLMDVLRPIQERRAKLEARGNVVDVLHVGARRAKEIASETIAEVRAKVGLGTP